MKNIFYIKSVILAGALLFFSSCDNRIYEEHELVTDTSNVDYSSQAGAQAALIGAYSSFNDMGWEQLPLLGVRGDDVNSGGGSGTSYDQMPFHQIDMYQYDNTYWMTNSLWSVWYNHILQITVQIEQLEKFRAGGVNSALIDQYQAECITMRAFLELELARVWGAAYKVESSDQTKLTVETKDDIMKWIKSQLETAIPKLQDMRPNQRTDLAGGITKYTALAIKAMAELELKDYAAVATDTGAIINSGKFNLFSDFNNLFKIPGKLANENLLEVQYSDFGTASGLAVNHLWAFYGPTDWTPVVSGAGGGWGFWEPSEKYIKFMLSRGEKTRLQASVLFTPNGINLIKSDPNYATLPSWISNTTLEGDVILNQARLKFNSGKHYLPSNQLTSGRTDYGSNKNLIVIRYAEILLMYAEAVTRGGAATAGTADAAVNLVRQRAGLSALSGVTSQQVMDEKYAELGMEWGIRYFDMVRLGNTSALSYDGRTFTTEKAYLPFPSAQVDKSKPLQEYIKSH